MKEMVTYSDVPYLPEEMITNILKRLPPKLLIPFQRVCKDWKYLLKTPYFIAEQVQHFTQQNPCLVFKRGGDYGRNPSSGHLCFIGPDSQFLQQQIPISRDCLMGSCRIVNPSNGYICLEFMKSESLFLWNLANREVYQVPKGLSLSGSGLSYVGFGFSPIVNDYKIVRFLLSFGLNDDEDRVHTIVEVFSLSTRSWKEVEVEKLKGVILVLGTCGFTFDGFIFWFGFTMRGPLLIISFDIAREDFTLMPFPHPTVKSVGSRLTVYDNKLAMLSCRSGFDIIDGGWTSIDLWVMEPKEGRWIRTKVCTSKDHPSLYPVTIWRNEIVCKVDPRGFIRAAKGVIEHNETLVLCNLHTHEFKTFDMAKCPINNPIWNYA